MLTSISLNTLAQTSTSTITGVVRDGATGETMPGVNVLTERTHNGAYTRLTDPFFSPAFKGAFGSENWTSGWCNWNPQNTAY